ncbi:MAG: alpha/beta hydrolase [Cyclobacteriaceae bacterium]|nr:alpha/beta hydrolase [Cyclobacteriaceae bacterium]
MTLVDENLKLHSYAKGEGKYTLVFTAGFGSPSAYLDYFTLANNLSHSNKVVVYDRAGIGWSDEAPIPLKLQSTSEQLHTLLHKNNHHAPYVLVAHSFGALEMIHFASKYREEVAGIVLIDGVSPQTYLNFNPEKSIQMLRMISRNKWLFKLSVNFGLIGEATKRKKILPKELIKLDQALLKKNFANQTMIETAKQIKQYAERVRSEVSISDIPLLVISCKGTFTELGFSFTNWEADQHYLTTLSNKSKQVFVSGSHSTVHLSEQKEIQTLIQDFILSF